MMSIKHQKPRSFFKQFDRKGENPEVSHYCPGCGHGTVHNLIAEAIDDLGLQDRTIFCSPVGCSVFGYYYFDTGNIQCAHGRAPTVASAIRRTHRDAIVISYQGDGDLAGIGLSHIIHAANRGENITVFFVNNAIYGMTGGQMAPTTLVGQKTVTTPNGRNQLNDGGPMRMAEIIATLSAPAYVERVSLADPKRILKARKAIRQGLQNQIDGKGFSFVEILSPCPINWKMTPIEAREWMIETLEKQFPLQCFADRAADIHPDAFRPEPILDLPDDQLRELLAEGPATENRPPAKTIHDQHVKIAGFGGQGVLSAGVLLSACATHEGFNTTWLPSYGPEMRGGVANASINFANDKIGSPIVSCPNVLFALNGPSLDSLESTVAPGGLILVNQSLVKRQVGRTDVRAIYVPASEMAQEIGVPAALTTIMLAVYAQVSGCLEIETLRTILPTTLKRKALLEANRRAIDVGLQFATAQAVHHP
jgi:2-oxoisovalerate ferredoxin oxidoreductase beta subunit